MYQTLDRRLKPCFHTPTSRPAGRQATQHKQHGEIAAEMPDFWLNGPKLMQL
jgi:hypothetical protein